MTACPNPEKVRYPGKRSARRAMRRIQDNRADGLGRLHVYPCGDHFHVGHIARESWRDRHR